MLSTIVVIFDNYSFVTIYDTLPPYTIDHNPENGATHILPDTSISISVMDDGVGVNPLSLCIGVDIQLIHNCSPLSFINRPSQFHDLLLLITYSLD